MYVHLESQGRPKEAGRRKRMLPVDPKGLPATVLGTMTLTFDPLPTNLT